MKTSILKKSILRTMGFAASAITVMALAFTSCTNNQKQPAPADAKFLATASKINLEEIQLGQLAQKNSMVADVKDLGSMMVTDHSNAQDSLKALAEEKHITIPDSLTDADEDGYNKLVNKTGAEFDKLYCDMMVKGHTLAVAKFTKESTDAVDPDIRAWAASMVPVLQKHLEHSMACQKECDKM